MTLIRVKKAKLSQSVFASMLNVSVSAVQKWESPSSGEHPSGAAAKLLQLIDKKGLEAIVAGLVWQIPASDHRVVEYKRHQSRFWHGRGFGAMRLSCATAQASL